MTDAKNHEKQPTVVADAAPRTYVKTPLFAASNASRYQRQDMIKAIEKATPGRRVLCFVSGKHAEIDRDDTAGFVDLLYNVQQGESVDLLLHTGGGDIDAAEKLIKVVQAKIGPDANIRVVVPDFAKSAGTLMALGAHSIIMSDSSELGAIDPQVPLKDRQGNEFYHSVLRYLDAYHEHAAALRRDRDDPVAQLMFDNFDPSVVRMFQGIRDRVRSLAEDLLKRRGLPFTDIVSNLMDISRWKSHNQMISALDARSIGLDVEIVPNDGELWRRYWELHCHQRLAVNDKQKIFESVFVSLVM